MSEENTNFENETLELARQPFMTYLKEVREATEATVKSYGRDFDLIVKFFKPDKKIQKILPTHVSGYIKSDIHLKRKNGKDRAKPSTDKTARLLRMFLEWCEETKRVEKAPIPLDIQMGAKSKRDRDKALKEREERNKASEKFLEDKKARKEARAKKKDQTDPEPEEPTTEAPETEDAE